MAKLCSSTSRSKSRMSLLQLPIDVRLRIWKLLLIRSCPINITNETQRLKTNTLRLSGPDIVSCECSDYYFEGRPHESTAAIPRCQAPRLYPQILRVCKEIFQEAHEVLYKGNRFTLTGPSNVSEASFNQMRSVHFHFSYTLGRRQTTKFQQQISRIRLSPEARLTITCDYERNIGNTFQKVARSVKSLGPVRSCSVRMKSPADSELLAKALLQQTPSEMSTFHQFSRLPKELQLHILSYTDLTQEYVVVHGLYQSESMCCGTCCDTSLGCCCRQVGYGLNCSCQLSPAPFFLVSREFRRDALEVAFNHGFFIFRGGFESHMSYLMNIEPFLPMMRQVILMVGEHDFGGSDGEDTSSWNEFISYLQTHMSLSQLRLSVLMNDLWLSTVDDEDEDGHENEDYRSYMAALSEPIREELNMLVSGLRKLAERGLMQFTVRLSNSPIYSNLLIERKYESVLERAVMGDDYINEYHELLQNDAQQV